MKQQLTRLSPWLLVYLGVLAVALLAYARDGLTGPHILQALSLAAFLLGVAWVTVQGFRWGLRKSRERT